jgi:hypothetical protein
MIVQRTGGDEYAERLKIAADTYALLAADLVSATSSRLSAVQQVPLQS